MLLKKLLFVLSLIIQTVFISHSAFAANSEEKIQQILSQSEEPAGVVFEIVSSAKDALNWAIPQTQKYIKQLRKRFKDLPVAIVTHGNEQFALQKQKRKQNEKVHQLTRLLVEEEGVPVHVCGTYAGWRGVAEEDFPEYVDVTAAGPATINDYIALGYILIKI